MKLVHPISVLLTALILSTGCQSGLFAVKVPPTKITTNPKTGEVTFASPNDGSIRDLIIESDTNGNFKASIGSWDYRLNPTNVTASADGSAKLADAFGNAVVNGINAAGNTAGKFTGSAAGAAIKGP